MLGEHCLGTGELKIERERVRLWCLMLFSTIFQLYCGDHSVFLVEKTVVPRKNNRAAAGH
jgi:hypothetical protein